MRKQKIERDGIIYVPCFNGLAVKGVIRKDAQTYVKIPSSIDGITVVRISENAFNNQSWIKELYLPYTIEAIEDRAFYECKSLHHIIFDGSNVPAVSVGRAAFYNCSELVSVGRYVKLDGPFAFQNCYHLTDVATVGSIPIGSFWGDYNLKNIHVFSNLVDPNVYIADGAFTGCSNIKAVFFYADNVELQEKELKTFRNANIYCEQDSNLLDLAYNGYDVQLML